jgi:hypothetical protein
MMGLNGSSLAPVITVNDETFGRLTPAKVVKAIKEVKKQGAEAKVGCSGGCHNA